MWHLYVKAACGQIHVRALYNEHVQVQQSITEAPIIHPTFLEMFVKHQTQRSLRNGRDSMLADKSSQPFATTLSKLIIVHTIPNTFLEDANTRKEARVRTHSYLLGA